MGHAQLSESVPFGSNGTPAMPSNISFARWEYASGGSGKGAWVSSVVVYRLRPAKHQPEGKVTRSPWWEPSSACAVQLGRVHTPGSRWRVQPVSGVPPTTVRLLTHLPAQPSWAMAMGSAGV